MSKHDEAIRKAKKEIEKLSADIEKKKARIRELQGQIRQHEAAKAKDAKFSDLMLEMMSDNGIVSEDDRNDVLQKMNEYLRTLANKKSEFTEISAEDKPDEIEETAKPEAEPAAASEENLRAAPTSNYQNPAYPYRPTSNGNINS